MQRPRRNSNDANTKSGVHKSLVQIFRLERRHTAIFPSLPVEDQIRSYDGPADDSRTVSKLRSKTLR